MSLDLFVKLKY